MEFFIDEFTDSPYDVPVKALVPLFGIKTESDTLPSPNEAVASRVRQAILEIAPAVLMNDFTLKTGGMKPSLRR